MKVIPICYKLTEFFFQIYLNETLKIIYLAAKEERLGFFSLDPATTSGPQKCNLFDETCLYKCDFQVKVCRDG